MYIERNVSIIAGYANARNLIEVLHVSYYDFSLLHKKSKSLNHVLGFKF